MVTRQLLYLHEDKGLGFAFISVTDPGGLFFSIMIDEDIRDSMHSANPKVYEAKRIMRNRSYEAERVTELNIMESEMGLSSARAAQLLEEYGDHNYQPA